MAAPSIQIVDCAARHFANLPRTGWLISYFPDAPGEAIFTEPAPALQVGPEIEGPFEDDMLLRHGQTPIGRAAFTSFRGTHEMVEQHHRAIRDWCTGNGETFTGAIWERYVWNSDPDLQVIEIYYLLA